MWIGTPGEYNAVYVSENLTLEVDRYMDGQSILCETSPAENWHKTFDDSVVLDINRKLSPYFGIFIVYVYYRGYLLF